MTVIRIDATKQYYATSSLVVGYALCSSLLTVINKIAITKFNYPCLLTSLQYMASSVSVWIIGKLGFLYHDPLNLETAKKILPAAIVFFLAIFTNTNLLRHANVDTFIVSRSLTPLLVAIADTSFRNQPCPSKLTFLSLVIILSGAVGYVMTDSAFTLTAYSWALANLITITSEMVYIKHTAVGSNNGDLFDFGAFVAVTLSCVFGFLISFFGFAARKAISATAFTVTGGVLYQHSVTGKMVPSAHDESASAKTGKFCCRKE